MPDQQDEDGVNALDLDAAVDEAAYGLFLADIRRAVTRYGFGVSDKDMRRLWDEASPIERFYWQDQARPIVYRSAPAILDAGWNLTAELLGIEGHDSPWRHKP